ncbi:unnamed protein product [Arabidopsis halleri]
MSVDEESSHGKTIVKTGNLQEMGTMSPYYLHASEGPGNLITTVQLKGENYEDWAKHVRNALRTKRKLGFIDGTLKKPSDQEELQQWEVVNSMLVAWIMNTIDPILKTSITLIDDASVLWEDLKLHFSVGNGPRVHELKADLANCKQKGDSVMMYYGKLKKMWDELAVYQPLRSCSYDVRFGGIRSTLTNMEPLLKLSQVYQRVVRDERQQSITRNKDGNTESVGFAVQASVRNKPGTIQFREKDITCTHCGKYGHEISDCYQIKGYPDWWGKEEEISEMEEMVETDEDEAATVMVEE